MSKHIVKRILRYVLIVLIVITCYKIFTFSAEEGKVSSSTSKKVAIVIIKITNKNIAEQELLEKVALLEPFIRKLAHFSIYMFLGILVASCSITFKWGFLKRFNISVLFNFVYACTDEYHQLFVPGRSGRILDILIDTLGAFSGIVLVLIIYKILHLIISKRPKKEIKKSVLFVASTGGHLNELMQVKTLFKKYNYHIVTEKTEIDNSLKKKYGDNMSFLIYGTKKYPIKYIFKFLANCFISLYYFFKFQPEVIVTTGTHTAVPMCYIGKIFGAKIIFIETFANRTTGTVAGKLVYPIADTFVVQWEEMHKVYPKSVCWGWIY